jgi:HK97 family phage major capsid protein
MITDAGYGPILSAHRAGTVAASFFSAASTPHEREAVMTPSRTATILAEVDSLLHKPTLSREDSARAEQLLNLADSLVDRSELRRAISHQRDLELGRVPSARTSADEKFRAYLSIGPEVLSLEEKRAIGTGEGIKRGIKGYLGVGTGSSGGYIVPQSFADRFESILKQTDELFSLAMMFETKTGAPTGYPILDDTGAAAAIVAEQGASTEVDEVFAALSFGQCPTYRSGTVIVSVELAADSAFDLEGLTAGAFAIRFARGVGAAYVATLLTSAALGVTAASATAIAGDELIELTGEIDSAYLPNASWLMLRSTFLTISQLTGSSGNFLFPSRRDANNRPTLLDFPVYFSPSMGPMTANGKSVSFGDHSKFVRRQVKDSLQVRTLVELYAASGKVGYLGYLRCDGGLLLSGSNIPVAYLQQAA